MELAFLFFSLALCLLTNASPSGYHKKGHLVSRKVLNTLRQSDAAEDLVSQIQSYMGETKTSIEDLRTTTVDLQRQIVDLQGNFNDLARGVSRRLAQDPNPDYQNVTERLNNWISYVDETLEMLKRDQLTCVSDEVLFGDTAQKESVITKHFAASFASPPTVTMGFTKVVDRTSAWVSNMNVTQSSVTFTLDQGAGALRLYYMACGHTYATGDGKF